MIIKNVLAINTTMDDDGNICITFGAVDHPAAIYIRNTCALIFVDMHTVRIEE